MSKTSFPVVRGNMMRITKVDGCGKPIDGPGNMITTDGFVSVALSSNITTGDEITVQCELTPSARDGWGQLSKKLGADLAHAHEGLRFQLELADVGALPRFELKAKRLQDRREQ